MRKTDRDLEKLRFLLRHLIAESGWTQTEIQRRCGWGGGALSQMLNGRKSLKMEAVLTLLGVLGVEPGRFFAQLFGTGSAVNAYRFIEGAASPSGSEEVR